MKTKFAHIPKILSLVLVLSLFFCPLSASASEVMPAFENCGSCSLDFYITNAGVAEVIVDYVAYEDTFTYIEVTVKIQKRTLGIFWKTVDIGEPDNEFYYASTKDVDIIYEEFAITETGTYRAVFEVKFHGINGLTDEINDTVQHTYS